MSISGQTRKKGYRQTLRPHLCLHGTLIGLLALISYWGQGPAFLVIYLMLLATFLGVVGVVACAMLLWRRFRRLSAGTTGLPGFRRFLKPALSGFLLVLAVATTTAVATGVVARFSDGPIGPFPGGELSGELVTEPVTDWSFLGEFEQIQVQVCPDHPRSVTTGSLVYEGDLYVGADFFFPFKKWVHLAMKDPRAIVGVRGKLYPRRAVRITDPDEVRLLESELARRNAPRWGGDPNDPPGFLTEVWIFRMAPP